MEEQKRPSAEALGFGSYLVRTTAEAVQSATRGRSGWDGAVLGLGTRPQTSLHEKQEVKMVRMQGLSQSNLGSDRGGGVNTVVAVDNTARYL